MDVSDAPIVPHIESNPAARGILFVIGSLQAERDGIRIMVRECPFGIDGTELSEIVLAIVLDEVELVIEDELLVDHPEHIGDIEDGIFSDILEHISELIIVEDSPETGAMLIEGIRPIGFEIILIVGDIVGYQIGAIAGLGHLAADEALDADDQGIVVPHLDV